MAGGKQNPLHARKWARRAAIQALYQWQLSDLSLNKIEKQFRQEQDMRKVDMAYFSELLHKVPASLDELDEALLPYLDRSSIEEVDPIERAILRLGVYELKFKMDVPFKVVISEGVHLAKTFGSAESHKYINGILDKVARQLRKVEMKAKA
ncbi:MAG: transcription antitermination factor NusB [Gammaproteobacteria bacterium]|nr:transcription antitermination factor NusB [Gammaproteobacteria bacterium]MCK5091382.1 transcription antitermination factor NusB [Gammaproteobacteria bacterium]